MHCLVLPKYVPLIIGPSRPAILSLSYCVLLVIKILNQKGYGHGDIKTVNIMQAGEDSSAHTPIICIDFGSSQPLDSPPVESTHAYSMGQRCSVTTWYDRVCLASTIIDLVTGSPPTEACETPESILSYFRGKTADLHGTRLIKLGEREWAPIRHVVEALLDKEVSLDDIIHLIPRLWLQCNAVSPFSLSYLLKFTQPASN